MNRKETTKLLTDILVSDVLSDRKYYAKEVTLDYGTDKQKRVDMMQFSPRGVIHTSDIEKGIFVCYEIKSCVDDVYSGHGLNFFGEKNYIVTTMETYRELQKANGRKLPNLRSYIEAVYPESSNNFGLLVAVPKCIDLRDTDALHKEYAEPTEFKGSPHDWRLWTAIPCNIGHRDRSTSELLFCMLRSKHSYTNKEEYNEKSKWISVIDKTPEEGQEVLTVVKPFKNSKSYRCEVFRYENKHWVYTDDDEVVTHWQPLPELPKELRR